MGKLDGKKVAVLDDIPAFSRKMVEEFCEGRHDAQAQKTAASVAA